MATEIEAKLKVDSFDDIERRLTDLGAEFVGEYFQKDYYFDDSRRSLTNGDMCLRLRCQTTCDRKTTKLTYKGAKEKNDFKKRREIEIEISDSDALTDLLSALGYTSATVVEKKRRLWRIAGCEVALDRLPQLGSFVEVEGPTSETIAGVQRNLGLGHLPHIPQSYACLIEQNHRG